MDSRSYRIILILKLQVIFCFVSLPCSTFAQEYLYFNQRFDLNELNEIDWSYNIVMNDDGYIIAGNSIVYGETIYWWEKVFAKINFEGQVGIVKHYEEDSVEYFFSYTPDYITKVESHYYAVGIRREPATGWFHQEATLMYLDENLDTIWMKRFGEKIEPYDTAFYFTSLQNINQYELIMTGGRMPQGLNTQVYLLKTDSAGNKIWDNSFTYGNFYISGRSIAQTTDLGYIIGCFKQEIGYTYTVDPVIIKTDSMGNKEWTKNLGGPYADNAPMVTISNEGNIILGISIADSMLNSDVPISRINFVKLDNQGNVVWNKKYGSSRPNNFLRKIRVLEDGSIIAVGATTKNNPEPDRVGWILKTDSEGDSLWYREYAFLTGYESRNYLYDVIETSDNGLIACGYVDPYPPDTGSTDTWIIKLDSIGCQWAGCDTTVGLEEHGGMEARGHGGLEVWPNPCREMLNVECSMLNSGKACSLTVFDIYGRVVHSSLFQGGGREGGEERQEVQFTIDVSSLPPGIYFLSVVEEGKRIAGGKFVVAH